MYPHVPISFHFNPLSQKCIQSSSVRHTMWIIWGFKTHGSGQQLQLTTHPSTKRLVFFKFSDSIHQEKTLWGKDFFCTLTILIRYQLGHKWRDFSQRYRVAAEFEMAHLIHSARKTWRHLQRTKLCAERCGGFVSALSSTVVSVPSN